MTQERKDQIKRRFDEWMRLRDKSGAEKQMLKAIQELLEDVHIDPATLESEYKRGYDEGAADERDRQYDAKMAAKKPKKEQEKLVEPDEMPFGEAT